MWCYLSGSFTRDRTVCGQVFLHAFTCSSLGGGSPGGLPDECSCVILTDHAKDAA